MNAIPVFYSPLLLANAGSYSPSAGKPAAVLDSWVANGFPIEVLKPACVERQDYYRAHSRTYVDDVLDCRVQNGFGNISEDVAASLPYTSGAMLAAAREALASGLVAVAPVAGFHHAGHAQGGGFCTFNGLMVTALALLASREARRVGILDYDYHYGDGTDEIMRVLAVQDVVHVTAGSKYQGCHRQYKADEFLKNIPADVARMQGCNVLLYQAGADPHINDPLGGWLTSEQLKQRDRRVFELCRKYGLPIAWNLAGGYQKPLRNVLDIHDETMRQAIAVFLQGLE